MLIYNEKLNPCKCGSKKKPDLDSDDFHPCWGVICPDCRQFQHGKNWSLSGAVSAWNEANPIVKSPAVKIGLQEELMEQFLRGKIAITRNRTRVRFIASLSPKIPAPILVEKVIGENQEEHGLLNYYNNGRFDGIHDHDLDLVAIDGL